MFNFFKEKSEAERLMEAAKEECKNLSDLVVQGKSLVDRIWDSVVEMVGSVEEDWFQGNRDMMVTSMLVGMLVFTGFLLYLIFSKDKQHGPVPAA